MTNATLPMPSQASLADLVCEQLDDLVSFAAHLCGNANDATEFAAAGIAHAHKYPPAHLQEDGVAVLYRSVRRACQHKHRFPPRSKGLGRIFRRRKPALQIQVDTQIAGRINTVKRALLTITFVDRSVLLLHDFAHLDYRQLAIALECSPESASRQLASARREFSLVYREISI